MSSGHNPNTRRSCDESPCEVRDRAVKIRILPVHEGVQAGLQLPRNRFICTPALSGSRGKVVALEQLRIPSPGPKKCGGAGHRFNRLAEIFWYRGGPVRRGEKFFLAKVNYSRENYQRLVRFFGRNRQVSGYGGLESILKVIKKKRAVKRLKFLEHHVRQMPLKM